METIICFFRGHRETEHFQKWEQMVMRGEKIGQSGIWITSCERCGLMQSSITGKWIGI